MLNLFIKPRSPKPPRRPEKLEPFLSSPAPDFGPRPRFTLIYDFHARSSPFRIVEHVPTCDGIRSRLTDKSFSDYSSANRMCKDLNSLFARRS